MRFAFPRPGRALWAVLILIGAGNILLALLANWTPVGERINQALECNLALVIPQLWRLVSSGLLTDPHHLQHLLFTLVGLYFLSPSLEKGWGGRRFLTFLALSVAAGNLLVMGVSALAGPAAPPAFHPVAVFGPYAAISGIAVAWARENAEQQALLFFVIPVKGKYLLWFTLAMCVLALVFQDNQITEGMVAPFGGVITGVLLSGSPSPLRAVYLRTRLFFLRRKRSSLTVDDILEAPRSAPQPRAKKSRSGAPPLRVVQGGLDEVLKNRKPPKDKRYLN